MKQKPRSKTNLGLAYLSDVYPDQKPWDKHRSNSDRVTEAYYELNHQKYFERILQCANELGFAPNADPEAESKLKLTTARFCRLRHCPVCQWRRQMKWRSRAFEDIPKLVADNLNLEFIFLTLTVKNCERDKLKETIKWMNQSWKKLTKYKSYSAKGFIKSLEVTKSCNGLAHPHFHILLAVDKSYFKSKQYISQAQWRELWKKALKVDYLPVVNVKKARLYIEASDSHTELQNVRPILELLKYGLKPADILDDSQWLGAMTDQLHGVRAIALGGVFKQYMSQKQPDEQSEDDDKDKEIDRETAKFYFEWKAKVQKYQFI